MEPKYVWQPTFLLVKSLLDNMLFKLQFFFKSLQYQLCILKLCIKIYAQL